MRVTDAADTKTLLRIIQSVRSTRAEPFKRWLAEVGTQRIEEIENPELAISFAQYLNLPWHTHFCLDHSTTHKHAGKRRYKAVSTLLECNWQVTYQVSDLW